MIEEVQEREIYNQEVDRLEEKERKTERDNHQGFQ